MLKAKAASGTNGFRASIPEKSNDNALDEMVVAGAIHILEERGLLGIAMVRIAEELGAASPPVQIVKRLRIRRPRTVAQALDEAQKKSPDHWRVKAGKKGGKKRWARMSRKARVELIARMQAGRARAKIERLNGKKPLRVRRRVAA